MYNDMNDESRNENSGYYSHYSNEEKRSVSRRTFLITVLALALVCCLAVGTAILFGVRTAPGELQSAQAVEAPSADEAVSDEATGAADKNGSTADKEPASQGLNMAAPESTQYSSTTQMLQNCMSSIVGIYIEGSAYGMGGQGQRTDIGSGSGVIITADGYIVTNNHVVQGAQGIRVYLQDGTEYAATLVGTDDKTDLAMIKIDASNLPNATLGSSGNAVVGESVFAIGNPLGVLTSSVSSGIVSGLDRNIEIDGKSMTLMQTDAAVNPGNSGGGLFNSSGQLIGVINAKSSGTAVEGLGFAIPIDTAKPVITDLMDYGYVSGRPYIGVSMQNVSMAVEGGTFSNPFGIPSYVTRVMVMEVVEGSAADKCGIKPNDIILSFDGTEIDGYSDLSALLYEYNSGDAVKITVQRGNETLELTLTLGERTSG